VANRAGHERRLHERYQGKCHTSILLIRASGLEEWGTTS
jgi:hypothetical protein